MRTLIVLAVLLLVSAVPAFAHGGKCRFLPETPPPRSLSWEEWWCRHRDGFESYRLAPDELEWWVRSRAVPALVRAVRDERGTGRVEAVRGLARITSTRPDLTARVRVLLEGVASSGSEAALEALGHLPYDSRTTHRMLAVLDARRDDVDLRRRRAALLGLGRLRVETGVLREILRGENERHLLDAAIVAMGLSGNPKALPILLDCAERYEPYADTGTPELALASASHLVEAGASDRELADLLVTWLDRRRTTRLAAVTALGWLAGRPEADPRMQADVLTPLAALTVGEDEETAGRALVAVAQIAAEAADHGVRQQGIEALEEALEATDGRRRFALLGLGLVARGSGVPAEERARVVGRLQVELSGRPDDRTRRALIVALGLARDGSSVPPLLEILESDRPGNLRETRACAEALGSIGSGRARGAFRRYRDELGVGVSWRALVAARRCGDAVTEDLVAILRDDDAPPIAWNRAARALGRIPEGRSIEALVSVHDRLTRDEDAERRILATRMLVRLIVGPSDVETLRARLSSYDARQSLDVVIR